MKDVTIFQQVKIWSGRHKKAIAFVGVATAAVVFVAIKGHETIPQMIDSRTLPNTPEEQAALDAAFEEMFEVCRKVDELEAAIRDRKIDAV